MAGCMASFTDALERLLEREGRWVDDPADRGGETYCGISRTHHPDWSGWRRIDAAKQTRGFPRTLERDRYLPRMVAHFYRSKFWNAYDGDALADERVATVLLDMSVHLGQRTAVKMLQDALNLLNRNGRDYTDLLLDGICGPRTRAALSVYLAERDAPTSLLTLLGILRGSHYLALLRSDPTLERYARGWLARL
jgi:lysozyme family protein